MKPRTITASGSSVNPIECHKMGSLQLAIGSKYASSHEIMCVTTLWHKIIAWL